MQSLDPKKEIITKIYKALIILETIVMVFLFSTLSKLVFQVTDRDLLAFFLFQIFGMIIPGFAISGIYRGELSFVERICFSYSIGYAINVLEYFAAELIHRTIPYSVLAYGIGAIAILFICIFRKRYVEIIKCGRIETSIKHDVMLITILMLILIFNILVFACNYKDTFSMSHDMSWWVNNSVALKIKFPPDNLFMSGTGLFYHYFSSMQIAFSSLVTGIDVVSLSVIFYSLTKTIVMAGAVFFALNVMKIRGIACFLGVVLILFTTGMEDLSVVTYFHHILLRPFGFDIGFSFGLFFVSFIYLQVKERTLNKSFLFFSLLFWAMCVGAKAPVAAVLLMMPGILCIYWLIKGHIAKSLIYGISILGVFLIISMSCVGLLSVAKGDSASYFLSFHSISDLKMYGGRELPILEAIILKWIAMSPTIAGLLLISAIDYCAIRKKDGIKSEDRLLINVSLCVYICGIVLWRIILADGASEMYYAMTAFIPAYFIVGNIHKNNSFREISPYKSGLMDGLKISLCILGLFFFMYKPYDGVGAEEYAISSIKNIRAISNIESDDMDGLRWVRDNTELNSLVLSDSAVMTGNDRYYFYGIVSERQQYIEGVHMLRFGGTDVLTEIERREDLAYRLYNNDYSVIEELKRDGVDYVIQSNSITPSFQADEDHLVLVNSSDNINVYAIK